MKRILLLALTLALSYPASAQQLVGDVPPSSAAQKLLDTGDDCYNSGDFAGALRYYTRAESAELRLAHAHYNRAAALFYLKRRAEALAEVNASLRLNPKYAEAYNLRGRLEEEHQQSAPALADYSRAIAFAGNAFVPELGDDALTNRGRIRARCGNFAGALADYNRVLLDAPSDTVLYSRGLLWEKQHRWDEALRDYTAALNIYPHYANGFVSRGRLRFVRGDRAGALGDFDRALATPTRLRTPEGLEHDNAHNDESWCLTNRSLVYLAQGRRHEARRDLNRAIMLNPKNLCAYDSRGDERASMGDRAGAIADYRQAATLYRREHNPVEAAIIEAKIQNARVIP